MKINPPNWQKDAVMTVRGWVHPKTKELLVSRKFTQLDIDAYQNSLIPVVNVVEVVEEAPKVKKTKRNKKVQAAIEQALENQ